MLGADDQHVASVAVGDDLLLQVLRRLFAPQVGLERAAQPGPLLTKTVSNAPQLRTRIVHNLAAGIDLLADVVDLALEGRRRVGNPPEVADRCAGAPDSRGGALDRREKRGQRQQVQRFEGPAFYRDRREDFFEVGGRLQADLTVREEAHGLCGCGECTRDCPGFARGLEF